jgi:hypothetical protein
MHPTEEDAERVKQVSSHERFSGLLTVMRTSDHTMGFDDKSDLQRLQTPDRVRAVELENMEEP